VTLLTDAPAKLIGGALIALVLTTLLSVILVWHALRRVFDVPRVPRPRALYWLLTCAWGALALGFTATAMTALLLRDHRPVDGRTPIGEVTCAVTGPGHVRAELRAAAPPAGAAPERYDLQGEACVFSVKEVELRPGLQALGLQALARVDAIGPLTRPAANPGWLTPGAGTRPRMLGLVVGSTRTLPVLVPADSKQRFVLVAAPGQAPALVPASI
jgi:hypothetical protein